MQYPLQVDARSETLAATFREVANCMSANECQLKHKIKLADEQMKQVREHQKGQLKAYMNIQNTMIEESEEFARKLKLNAEKDSMLQKNVVEEELKQVAARAEWAASELAKLEEQKKCLTEQIKGAECQIQFRQEEALHANSWFWNGHEQRKEL